jgi:hypothetical protein
MILCAAAVAVLGLVLLALCIATEAAELRRTQ